MPKHTAGSVSVEYSASGRASCKKCHAGMGEGRMRVGVWGQSHFFDGLVVSWYHPRCYFAKFPRGPGGKGRVERTAQILGAGDMRWEDQLQLAAGLGEAPDACGRTPAAETACRTRWTLRDALEDVGIAGVRALLRANGLAETGGLKHLVQRCVDGMLYGALEPCPDCGQEPCTLYWDLDVAAYRCGGDASEWARCAFSSPDFDDPRVRRVPWKMPPGGTGNAVIDAWKQPAERLPLPPAAEMPQSEGETEVAPTPTATTTAPTPAAAKPVPVVVQQQPQPPPPPPPAPKNERPFEGKSFVVSGRGHRRPHAKTKELIEKAGGRVSATVTGKVNFVVTTATDKSKSVQTARSRNIPLVSERFLDDCLGVGALLDPAKYDPSLPDPPPPIPPQHSAPPAPVASSQLAMVASPTTAKAACPVVVVSAAAAQPRPEAKKRSTVAVIAPVQGAWWKPIDTHLDFANPGSFFTESPFLWSTTMCVPLQDSFGAEDFCCVAPEIPVVLEVQPSSLSERRPLVRKTIQISPCDDDFVPAQQPQQPPQPPQQKTAKAAPAKKLPLAKRAVNPDTKLEQTHHVYEDETGLYNAVLSNADITAQQNSYYNMQILQADDKAGPRKPAVVWIKYGRVGTSIGSRMLETFTHVESAVAFFKAKFEEKTKNAWDERKDFKKHPRLYFPVEVDYGDGDEEDKERRAAAEAVQSRLDGRVFELVREMFNADAMRRELASAGVDTQRMPLGKLSRQTVISGYEVLRGIETAIAQPIGPPRARALLELSNRYYSTIPHAVAAGQAPPIINTRQLLMKEMATLEALADVEAAASLMREEASAGDEASALRNPADARYQRLGAKLTPVREGSPEWAAVEEACTSTVGDDRGFKVRVVNVFRVQREGEAERFAPHSREEGRRLLWHGSRLSNMVGILKNGLRIAPPEAPVSGYMFGKGLYLADMAGKAAEYTHAAPGTNPHGVILLCEAALGKPLELERASYIELPQLAEKGLQSTKGLGRREPSVEATVDVAGGGAASMPASGAVVALGPEQPSGVDPNAVELDHHEYIVYEEARCSVRYALSVAFDFAPSWHARDLTYGLK